MTLGKKSMNLSKRKSHVFFYFLIIYNLAKTKDSSDYVEVVPNNTITVFVEWGRLSDIYEILINDDIMK